MDLCPIIYMAPGIGGLMARLGLLVVSWLLIIATYVFREGWELKDVT
jgi:hypothetical protein